MHTLMLQYPLENECKKHYALLFSQMTAIHADASTVLVGLLREIFINNMPITHIHMRVTFIMEICYFEY